MPRPLVHQRGEMRLEFGHAVAVARGDEESLVERDPGVDLGRDGEELVLPGQVDLVEHQIFLLGPVRDAFEDALDAPRQLRGSVDHDEDRLGLLERSEEHTSELQSLMRISYAVFCLKNKTNMMSTMSYAAI